MAEGTLDENFVMSTSSFALRQKHPCLHRIRTKLKRFDQFAFVPIPRFVREKQVSLRGLLGTTVSILLLFAYFAVSLQRFLNGAPSVSQVQQPPDMQRIDFTPLAFVFRVNDADLVPRRIFYNESYFKFVASITDVAEQDRYPRVVTNVPMVPCDVSSWAGWLGASAMCPNVTLQVRGRYQSLNYTFSRVDVIACDPNYPYVASDGSGRIVPCAPAAEISSVLSSGRFNLLQYFDSGIPGVDPSWEASMYLVEPSMWSLYEQSYAIRYVTINANYLMSWVDATYQALEMISEKFFSRTPAGSSVGGRYVLTTYFRLGSFNVEEARQVQTSMDFLGQLWAFFGLVLAVFALYFAKYNEDKFYEENPGWDAIDAQFRSKYDRLHGGDDCEEGIAIGDAKELTKVE